MKALARNSTGKAVQWRGFGHSANRRTPKIEIRCAPLPESWLLSFVESESPDWRLRMADSAPLRPVCRRKILSKELWGWGSKFNPQIRLFCVAGCFLQNGQFEFHTLHFAQSPALSRVPGGSCFLASTMAMQKRDSYECLWPHMSGRGQISNWLVASLVAVPLRKFTSTVPLHQPKQHRDNGLMVPGTVQLDKKRSVPCDRGRGTWLQKTFQGRIRPLYMGKTGRFGIFSVLCFLALGGRCLQMHCLPGFGAHANTQNLPHSVDLHQQEASVHHTMGSLSATFFSHWTQALLASCDVTTLRAKGALISEPGFSTPCEMRFFPREKGKTAFFKDFSSKKGRFPFLAWEKFASRRA